MSSKIITSAVAGALLVGAGLVTSVVSSPSTAAAQEEATETVEKGFFGRGLEFLGEVLDGLVADGTIDSSDAEAVLDAVEAKADEMRAQKEAEREVIQSAMEDGLITQDEVSELPDDHPIFGEAFDEAWEDGELTREELRENRHHPRRDAFRKGLRLGAFLDDGGIDEEEWAQIPDDHPLKLIDGIEDYFEGDGLITLDELREIREEHRPFHRTDDTSA